jgi:hypothetical protein
MSETETEATTQNKHRYIIIGLVIFTALGYWFGLRPYLDRKACYSRAEENSRYESFEGHNQERFDRIYGNCTKSRGL